MVNIDTIASRSYYSQKAEKTTQETTSPAEARISTGIVGSDAGLRVKVSNELDSLNIEVKKSGHGGGSGVTSSKHIPPPTSHYDVDRNEAARIVSQAIKEETEKKRQEMMNTLSPTLAMVATEEDYQTLLKGEQVIHKKAEEGDFFAKLYEHGKAMALMAEDIAEGVKDKLPLEDIGPVINLGSESEKPSGVVGSDAGLRVKATNTGKTVGEQIENAIGMVAGAIPFIIGLGEQAVATAGMAASEQEKGSRLDKISEVTEFLDKTVEYIVEGGEKQIEYVKEEPVGAALLFAAPEIKGVVETAVHPQRIPMHALIDVKLGPSTKRIPGETGRLEAYELIKQSLEGKSPESDIAPEFKESVREQTVYHATPDISPFMEDVVKVEAPNAQGIHTGGLYVGPEIYEHFLFKKLKPGQEPKPGALIIEHKGVFDYPARILEEVKEHPDVSPEPGKTFAHMNPKNFREIWESLEPTKKEVYLEAKEHVENTPGELVVSPQSTSGIGYRQYEVEGIITPGTELIRALNARSRLARKFGYEKGEYFMKVGGRHVELLHFGMEFETTPYTLSELYRLKARGAVEFAKSVGETVKKPFERVRDVFDEIRDIFGEETRETERVSGKLETKKSKTKDIDDIDRTAEELRRDFLEDVYRREIRRGMKRPWRAFDLGVDIGREVVREDRNWRDNFDIPWRGRWKELEWDWDGRLRPEPEPEKRPPEIPPDEPEWPLRTPPDEPPDIPDIPPWEPIDEPDKTRGRTKRFPDLSNYAEELDRVWSESYGYTELVHKFPTVEEMLFGKGKGGFIL